MNVSLRPVYAGRFSVRWLERLLLLVALASLLLCAWAWLDSDLYQKSAGRRLDEILARMFVDRAAPKSLTAVATRAEAAESGLIGRIEIPRLGVRAIVGEGTDARTLRRAVGHLPTTPLPGEPGNAVLAGHRDSFFRGLKDVRMGDYVRLTTPDGVLEYRVESKEVVSPSEIEVLKPSDAPTLTLITCFPFQYAGAAPERFVVRARQVEF